MYISGNDSTNKSLKIKNSENPNTGTDLLTIYNNGNIGIGMNTPTAKLNIEHSSTFGGGSGSTMDTSAIYVNNPNTLADNSSMIVTRIAGNNSTNKCGFSLYSSANAFGWSMYISGDDSTNKALNIKNSENPNTGTDLLTIKNNGNVGIGINNPIEKLDIIGNVKITGNLEIIGGTINGASAGTSTTSSDWSTEINNSFITTVTPIINLTNIFRTSYIFDNTSSPYNFSISSSVNVDIILVGAGGKGGKGIKGAGGGAGEVLYIPNYNLTADNYTITIGNSTSRNTLLNIGSTNLLTAYGGGDGGSIINGLSINGSISTSVSENIINSDESYYQFPTGTTSFTITDEILCDILIVGGGGGGGVCTPYVNGGGGGAGGVVYRVDTVLTSGTYNAIVGPGGIGGTTNPTYIPDGTSGTNSLIQKDGLEYFIGYGGGGGSLTSSSFSPRTGHNGGSGGGGYNPGSSIQGNTYWNGTSYIQGGTNATTTTGGGLNINNNITGTSQLYAAPGLYLSGTTNSAFGSGGGSGSSNTANGRDGTIIIRVKKNKNIDTIINSGNRGGGTNYNGIVVDAGPLGPVNANNSYANIGDTNGNGGSALPNGQPFIEQITGYNYKLGLGGVDSTNISSDTTKGYGYGGNGNNEFGGNGCVIISTTNSSNIDFKNYSLKSSNIQCSQLVVNNNSVIDKTYKNTNITATNASLLYNTIDNNYATYLFKNNGNINFPKATNCDVILVGAGGKGGLNSYSGGGGAGELIYYQNYPFNDTTYDITIGTANTNSINNRKTSITLGGTTVLSANGGGNGASINYYDNITATGDYTRSTISGSSDIYYTFRSYNCTLNLPNSVICDILVIGGGGGGGSRGGAGGGAGTLIYKTGYTLSSGNYSITIGNGGFGGSSATRGEAGVNGDDTSIVNSSGITIFLAKGGGSGAGGATSVADSAKTGRDGGCGGGGYNGGSGGNIVITNIPEDNDVFRNIGGSGTNKYGGGGGGAGFQGANGNNNGSTANLGNGGIPKLINITNIPTYYAGGGGAGNRISGNSNGYGGVATSVSSTINTSSPSTNGGAGDGGSIRNGGNSGLPNTGSGGGGGGGDTDGGGNGGTGGSGVVIIRLKTNIISPGDRGGGVYYKNLDITSTTSNVPILPNNYIEYNNTDNTTLTPGIYDFIFNKGYIFTNDRSYPTISKDPKTWYKFNNNITDMLINNGTLGGNLTNNSANFDNTIFIKGNGSAGFNGSTNSYLTISSPFDLRTIQTINGISFCVWFRSNDVSGLVDDRIFDFGNTASSGGSGIAENYISIGRDSYNKNVIFIIRDRNLNILVSYITSGINLLDGTWNHLVWTIDNSGVWGIYINTIYINPNKTCNIFSISGLSYVYFNIGRSLSSSYSYFNGNISDFRIYDSVLTASEVSTIYGSVNRSYPTIKNSDGTTLNPITWYKFDNNSTDMLINSGTIGGSLINYNATYDNINFVRNNGSVRFNGSTSYLQLETPFDLRTIQTANGISFSVWFKSANNDPYVNERIFHFFNTPYPWNLGSILPDYMIYIGRRSFSSNLEFLIMENTFQRYTTSGIDFFNQTWNHIVWTINNTGVWSIFINNTYINPNITFNIFSITGLDYVYYNIGKSAYSHQDILFGNIDDFRIYNRVLTTTEINELYNGRVRVFTKVDPGPIGSTSSPGTSYKSVPSLTYNDNKGGDGGSSGFSEQLTSYNLQLASGGYGSTSNSTLSDKIYGYGGDGNNGIGGDGVVIIKVPLNTEPSIEIDNPDIPIITTAMNNKLTKDINLSGDIISSNLIAKTGNIATNKNVAGIDFSSIDFNDYQLSYNYALNEICVHIIGTTPIKITKNIKCKLVLIGGGGGGGFSYVSSFASGGGGSGGYTEIDNFTLESGTYYFNVGLGGTVNIGLTGNNGESTYISKDNVKILAAGGGGGGSGGSALATKNGNDGVYISALYGASAGGGGGGASDGSVKSNGGSGFDISVNGVSGIISSSTNYSGGGGGCGKRVGSVSYISSGSAGSYYNIHYGIYNKIEGGNGETYSSSTKNIVRSSAENYYGHGGDAGYNGYQGSILILIKDTTPDNNLDLTAPYVRINSYNTSIKGNLGINMKYPQYPLDVYGNVRINAYATSAANDKLCFTSISSLIAGQTYNDVIKVSIGSFTEYHRCFIEDDLFNINDRNTFLEEYEGRVVVSIGKMKQEQKDDNEFKTWTILENKEGIRIDDAQPVIKLSRNKKDKRIYGVIGNKNLKSYSIDRIAINAIGEGGIWVVNTNGNIENGDLLQTSDQLGYAEKADDDIIRNTTIGKSVMNCNFELNSIYYKSRDLGNGIIASFIGCVYMCA
jgi:hypothetical protein